MADIDPSHQPALSKLTLKLGDAISNNTKGLTRTDYSLLEATASVLTFSLPYIADPWLIYSAKEILNT